MSTTLGQAVAKGVKPTAHGKVVDFESCISDKKTEPEKIKPEDIRAAYAEGEGDKELWEITAKRTDTGDTIVTMMLSAIMPKPGAEGSSAG